MYLRSGCIDHSASGRLDLPQGARNLLLQYVPPNLVPTPRRLWLALTARSGQFIDGPSTIIVLQNPTYEDPAKHLVRTDRERTDVRPGRWIGATLRRELPRPLADPGGWSPPTHCCVGNGACIVGATSIHCTATHRPHRSTRSAEPRRRTPTPRRLRIQTRGHHRSHVKTCPARATALTASTSTGRCRLTTPRHQFSAPTAARKRSRGRRRSCGRRRG